MKTSRRFYIFSLMPVFKSHQLTGQLVRHQAGMPICMNNQKAGSVLGMSFPKTLKRMMAIQPYIPTCQAVNDKVSALSA